MTTKAAQHTRTYKDFNRPDELIRFEPHHVAFARFADKWYSVGMINGNGWVMTGDESVDIEKEKSFYLGAGAQQVNPRPWEMRFDQ